MRFNPLMLVVLFVASLVAQVPVAHYTFDGGSLVNDVGPNLELTPFGTTLQNNDGADPCPDREGSNNDAYSFSDQYGTGLFYTLDDDQLPLGNQARTVCFWVCPSGISQVEDVVAWGASNPFRVAFDSDSLRVYENSSVASCQVYDVNYPANTWHHVAIVYTAERVRFYIDGTSRTTVSNVVLNTDADGNSVLAIGADAWAREHRLNGKLDDVCIYNRGLTGSEVYSIVNPTSVRTPTVQIKRGHKTTGASFTINGRALQTVPRFRVAVTAEKRTLLLR